MRHVDELRYALADETADLHLDLPAGLIRRRARRVRTRRAALVAAGLVLALAVPAGVLAARPDPPDHDVARPGPTCATPPDADDTIPWMGAPMALGLEARYNSTGRHEVLVGLMGGTDTPILTVAFRYEATKVEEFVHQTRLRRTQDGGLALRDTADTGRRLIGVRMNFGPADIVDIGLYAGSADRITVGAGGTETAATTVYNGPTGWTMFWVRHDPWSPQVAEDAQVQISAYAANGDVLASAPGTGGAGVRPMNRPTGDIPQTGCG